MQVQWQKLLNQLGVKVINDAEYQICPLHSTFKEPTLEVYHHPVAGWYHFRCIHSKCQFDGDAVQLIAKLRDLPIEDALREFTRAPLSDCLKDNLLDTEIQDYLDLAHGQAEVLTYVDKCGRDLHNGNDGSVLRHWVLNLGLKTEYLPTSLGRVSSIDPPRCLAIFAKMSFRKGQFLLFPYFFEGQLTELAAQQVDQTGVVGERHSVKLNNSGLGVFPAENLQSEDGRMIICESPLLAAQLIKNWKFKSNTLAPIVNIPRFPLPRECGDKQLILADTLEYPLSLHFGLGAYTCPNLVRDRGPVNITVTTIRRPLDRSSVSTFGNHGTISLSRWLAEKIIQHMQDNQGDVVVRALQAVNLSDKLRQKLMDKLSAHEEAMQLVSDAYTQGRGEITLANNMRIVKRPAGMYGISGTGAETLLSNVLIRVDSRVLTAEKQMAYECSFQRPDAEIVHGRLSEADFKSADNLQSAITRHFMGASDTGQYIACYAGGRNYKWQDIAAKLADGVPVRREVEHLGLVSDLNVHFPNFMIDAAQDTLRNQEQIFTLPEPVLGCYAGLIPGGDAAQAMDVVRKIFKNCDDMYVGAFVGGVCHVLYTILAAHQAQLQGRQAPRAHLCYAEPEEGVWAPTVHSLNLLFSQNTTVPYIPDNAKKHLTQLTALGALPYIGYLPEWSVQRLPGLMQTSPVNLITRVDTPSAAILAGEGTVSFIIPADYSGSDVNSMHPVDVLELQAALPEFIRHLLKQEMPIDLRYELRRTARPAHTAYRIACVALQIEPNVLMDELVNEFYTAMGVGSVQAFCIGLNRILYKDAELQPQNPYGAEIVDGPPTQELLHSKTPPMVFLLDDVVLLNKRAVSLVMKVTREIAFNTAALTAELSTQNYLRDLPKDISIDQNSYWTISRHMWDRYIKQEHLILINPVSSGDIIPLARLTA